jgi:hypothetical protein
MATVTPPKPFNPTKALKPAEAVQTPPTATPAGDGTNPVYGLDRLALWFWLAWASLLILLHFFK